MFKLYLAERQKKKQRLLDTSLTKKIILNKPKAFLADRLYLPVDKVNEHKIKRGYDRRVFNQKMCNGCQVFKDGDRFCDICSTCDGYKGRFVTYELTEIKGQDYFALPAGDLKTVQKTLDLNLRDFRIVDMRADVNVKHPLRFIRKLYTGREMVNGLPTANQVEILEKFTRFQTGIIQAAPRSGKTVLATHIYCGTKKRTLYLVHEKQLLLQFYRTVLDFTDLRQMRKKTGKKIVGIIQNPKDWNEDWDLVLCNYQQFITEKGFERLRDHIVRKFGQIMVDECLPNGTRIQTNKGEKNIEDIKVGDNVMSYNEKNNTMEYKKVLHTWNNIKPKPMVRIEHENGMLECTEDHLIYSITQNKYIPAKYLTNQDELLISRVH